MADRPAWIVGTEQFRLLWSDQDGAAFPSELAPLGSREYENADVERLAQLEMLANLRSAMNPTKQAAMAALTRPRYSISVSGLDARRPFTDTSHHIGIVSAWGGTGDRAVIARQKPGRSTSHGGDVAVTMHALSDWTADLVAMLPRSIRAGMLPADHAVPFDETSIDVEVLRQVSASAPKSTAAAAFVHRSPTTCGSLRVQVGSVADGRRPTSMTVKFRDIEGDGRYLLIIDSPGSALGVDDAKMASTLNRVINATKKLHDERVSAGRE